MSFALLSILGVLAGIAALAVLLWLIQRLRVEHREVEVLSTLFWQAAIEETRARVFVRRFRYWPAWLLLLAIASLMWLLFSRPQTNSLDGTQHVVVVDWSVEDPARRDADLQVAIDRAATLPTTAREIVAVSSSMETLLTPGEPAKLAALRVGEAKVGPPGIDWAIESLSTRASERHPLAIHIVGDVSVDKQRVEALGENVRIRRIERPTVESKPTLKTLGIADAASGRWDSVDVWFAFAEQDEGDLDERIAVAVDGELISDPIEKLDGNSFQLSDIRASGGLVTIQLDGKPVDSITLPRREPIRVMVDSDVPETIRQLVALDQACEIVSDDAEVRFGSNDACNFRLSADDQPAFLIGSELEDPSVALGELVDELALQQIDGTSIAEQSGKLVDVQVQTSPSRRVEVWGSLFSPSFDFQESRACPILISRSIRWLANRPPMVPWAQQGKRLPVASSEFDRVTSSIAVTKDGRELKAARIFPAIENSAELTASANPTLFSSLSVYTWLGLIVSCLLVGEWILFQRGRMP